MPLERIKSDIPELILIKTAVLRDNRGYFTEIYKYSDFIKAGIKEQFIQDNYSRSLKNVLRGLHYQKHPKAQGKLMRCLKGKIFDVAVDIRIGSPFYGQWVGHELSEDNGLMFYIPPFFAHGFVVLSEAAEILYKCTEEYSPELERGIIWNDPVIGIRWPVQNPILSERDKKHPLLKDADNNFRY